MDVKQIYTCSLRPDVPDKRDFKAADTLKAVKIPSRVSYVDAMPRIRDQGALGACASFATMRIIEAFYSKRVRLSPLFAYYNGRLKEFGEEGISEDSGNTLRGILKATNEYGFCLEQLWPYLPSNFAVKPPEVPYEDAAKRVKGDKLAYYRATDVEEVCAGMAQGYIPLQGIYITESFYSDDCIKSAAIPPPSGKRYGGHAVVISEYNRDYGLFTIDNSWGEDVGQGGRFYLPFEYYDAITMDCWLVKDAPDEVM